MSRLQSFVLLIALAFPCIGIAEGGEIRFNRDIRPILSENCFQCHGPDPGTRKADMRFDRQDGLIGAREDGAAVVAGDPDASLLLERILTEDPDEIMPPPETHKTIKPAEVKLIRRWIEEGAEWEDHWSFIKPVRPALPKTANEAWSRNPIDRFVFAGLEPSGLKHAPRSDHRALARRLALDVTGLPPSAEMVDRFVRDDSTGAVDRYLDKLFASPHHGEHMARYWLDAARYADTHGLHFDNYREMWPYRDWVITAFNRNMPFDQFTVEQLAGDLLPEPSLEQRVATGFHRCNITTNEGGVIDEEVAVLYARDRVETTGTVFLGLTLGCAVCHDHKFDPVSMKDFYSMSAFFRNLTQKPRDGNIAETPPIVQIAGEEERAELARLEEVRAAAAELVKEREAELIEEADIWISDVDPDMFAHPVDVSGLEFHLPLKGGQGSSVRNAAGVESQPIELPESAAWKDDPRDGPHLEWKTGSAIAGDVAKVDGTEAFSFAAWVKPGKIGSGAVFARMEEKDGFQGWDLWIQDGGRRFGTHLINAWGSDAMKVVSRDAVLKPGKWNHLLVTYDGGRKASGVELYLNGKVVAKSIERNGLKGSIKTDAPLTIGSRYGGSELPDFAIEDLRFYRRELMPAEAEPLASAREMRRLAGLEHGKEGRNVKLRNYYFSQFDPLWTDRRASLLKGEADFKAMNEALPVTHVMQENADGKPMAHILKRGNYDQLGDEVGAMVLESLHPLPGNAERNRMGLAEWIVSPENPLTARVTVNRLWQQILGTGLVGSAGDFGIMGENPSHPELLDWLAVEFVESGWDVRHVLRLILTSEAYAQSVEVTAEKLDKDPANRLLSRGPRFRMDAEMVRDSALASSGLLVRKVGGASVKPYQPEGVWSAVAMPNSNTKLYKADSGDKLYRRSLYTFWKRAAPPASMEIFNAPSREVCTVQRERTNTPLQALVTLNDPQLVEAARHLAENAIKRELHTEARLDFMTRAILSRSFTPEEQKIALESFRVFADFYRQNLGEAGELVQTGETPPDPTLNVGQLAAWTMLANQLYNLDETLNK